MTAKCTYLWSESRDRDTNQRSAQRRILFKLWALVEMNSEEGSENTCG